MATAAPTPQAAYPRSMGQAVSAVVKAHGFAIVTNSPASGPSYTAVVARAGLVPLRHHGRALVDLTCALAAGATCLSDVEAMTAQEEIFGPGGGASDTTLLRALDELADRLGSDGLPGRRLARAMARVRAAAWAGIVTRRDSGKVTVVAYSSTHAVRSNTRFVAPWVRLQGER